RRRHPHRALDGAGDLLVVLVRVMVGVHVNDEKVREVAGARLLARVVERLRLGELVVTQVADFVADHLHGASLQWSGVSDQWRMVNVETLLGACCVCTTVGWQTWYFSSPIGRQMGGRVMC